MVAGVVASVRQRHRPWRGGSVQIVLQDCQKKRKTLKEILE